MELSKKIARRFAVRTQLLHRGAKLRSGKEGTAQIIEKLGYIQIDTIAVIERAHHHTLWVRQPSYLPTMLDELQAKDRRVFEYWGHAASYLPMQDYRFYLAKMRNFPKKGSWEEKWLKQYGHLMKSVLHRIRAEGPLASKDFEAPAGSKRGPWWDWKPAKAALELLFWKGELMITERRKFQRVYDLTERVLPKGLNISIPAQEELGRFFVRRALSAYGVAQVNEIRDHIHALSKKTTQEALTDLIQTGEVTVLKIKELDADYYALTELMEHYQKRRSSSPQLFLLSPFDNLAIQRERIKRLFGFDYHLECYVPAAKRKFGYFSLPILWGDTFVGRLDPKAERKAKIFSIRNLSFEGQNKQFHDLLPSLAQKLKLLARFNGCDQVRIEHMSNSNYKKSLENQLSQ
ncbi:winged helix-turn-helix domain-containing protein [candidate division CSSED10-310 bacterium]|uniref:Winged helix-turn-helix domain-containing protein n=1 Tax=candidate division CSSED10-310 bacterium TaxID=2855610 RepID=A0ABV6YRS5_UNCC1